MCERMLLHPGAGAVLFRFRALFRATSMSLASWMMLPAARMLLLFRGSWESELPRKSNACLVSPTRRYSSPASKTGKDNPAGGCERYL